MRKPMRYNILAFLLILLFNACQSGQNSKAQGPDAVHKVTVKQVLQTSDYTYLLVSENEEENWLALPKMMATAGETYYYRNGLKMTNFESKELDKKFETVYFLESISSAPDLVAADTSAKPHPEMHQHSDTSSAIQYTAAVKIKKEDVKLEPAEKGITIAELLSNKSKYKGKTVRINGKVTKFNEKIMSRNLIHIQDGSEYEGKFDLTATTDIVVSVGETIILEGKVALNKDFGYGYFYEVLLEDSKLVAH